MGKPLPRNTNKKWCLFVNVSLGSVLLNILSTDITQPSGSLWLFMWKRHLGKWLVKCVENISQKNWKSHNTLKSAWNFFILSERYKNFRYILQIWKVNLMASFPSSPTYSVNGKKLVLWWWLLCFVVLLVINCTLKDKNCSTPCPTQTIVYRPRVTSGL